MGPTPQRTAANPQLQVGLQEVLLLHTTKQESYFEKLFVMLPFIT